MGLRTMGQVRTSRQRLTTRHIATSFPRPATIEAVNLLHKGALTLAKIERNGMKVDLQYVVGKMDEIAEEMERIEREVDSTELLRAWKKTYGPKFKFGADQQLATVLYDVLGVQEPEKRTEKGGRPVDADVVVDYFDEIPGLEQVLQWKKLRKARNTYLANILLETNEDGFLRSFFHLHLVTTFRSSSSNINFQNIPARLPEIGNMIRTAFIPRSKNRRILEIDYSGIEVRISACYHKDPTMIHYIENPDADMHRDMAAELFLIDQSEVTKQARYCAKNGFVFPEFYGSYYSQVAQNIWKMLDRLGVTAKDGRSMKQFLASKGIRTREQFEKHVEKVEKRFWGERFSVYQAWKDKWVEEYEKKGWFQSLTGFVYSGVMPRNKVINYPIQGSAFHCLLRSLIRLQEIAEEEGWKSCWIGQIHDSIVGDIVEEEREHILQTAHRVMCEELMERWKWIVVPIEIEAELTEPGAPWATKSKVDIAWN